MRYEIQLALFDPKACFVTPRFGLSSFFLTIRVHLFPLSLLSLLFSPHPHSPPPPLSLLTSLPLGWGRWRPGGGTARPAPLAKRSRSFPNSLHRKNRGSKNRGDGQLTIVLKDLLSWERLMQCARCKGVKSGVCIFPFNHRPSLQGEADETSFPHGMQYFPSPPSTL